MRLAAHSCRNNLGSVTRNNVGYNTASECLPLTSLRAVSGRLRPDAVAVAQQAEALADGDGLGGLEFEAGRPGHFAVHSDTTKLIGRSESSPF